MKNKTAKARGALVVKANEMIQKARFTLSEQEQKIILHMISKIKPNDTEFGVTELKIKDFCDLCGIDKPSGKDYKNVQDAIKTLADKSLWILYDNGDKKLFRWINKAKISTKAGTITLALDSDMKPLLLELKHHYTQYELAYTLAMRSRYSIRLYELLKSYQNMSTAKTFEIMNLKQLLSAETYDNFTNFRVKVLDIAIREINELSDISVSFEAIREGKKVTRVIFHFKAKMDFDERMKTWENLDSRLGSKRQSKKQVKPTASIGADGVDEPMKGQVEFKL